MTKRHSFAHCPLPELNGCYEREVEVEAGRNRGFSVKPVNTCGNGKMAAKK